MSARRTHRQELPQSTRSRSRTSSLDESRPAGCAPHQRCHLLGLQEGKAHLSSMLEGTPRTSAKIHLENKNERHVCTGEKEASLSDLTGLQVPDMARTYLRPAHAAVASRRSIRVPIPTAAAKEATPTVRRVRFSPAAVPSGTPQEEEEEEEDDIAGAAHLPQTFHHALPTFSVETGTTNLHFPPDHTFPDPLSVGGTPCKARLHSKLQHGFKTRSTTTSSC